MGLGLYDDFVPLICLVLGKRVMVDNCYNVNLKANGKEI